MNTWIYPGFELQRGAAWKAILAALETAIAAGQIRAGDVLPSQSLMADFMGVHVNTVNRAMREAGRRGLTSARTRRGTTVLAGRARLSSQPPSSRDRQREQFDITSTT